MDYIDAGPVATVSLNTVVQSQFREGCFSSPDDPCSLPTGFPVHLDSQLAWSGAQFKHHAEYVLQLTGAELSEVSSALHKFKGLELDGDLVTRDNFPLPTLESKLAAISHDLHDGKGFSVIRGINPNDYSVEDLTTIWLGLQAHIADEPGRQDHKGNMLVHIVADSSSKMKAGHHRHSTAAITFHNEEAGDVVSWLTRSTAAAGGKCIIASAYTIYNVLAAHRPDIIRTLAKSDWPFAMPRFQCRPVIYNHESRLIMNLSGRSHLIGSDIHPRPDHLPKVTDRQREALDAIEAIAQATQLEIQTQAGDMHFINNLAVLHRREGFVDGSTGQEKRHLVRMRLRNSQLGWAIPDALQRGWHDAFDKKAIKTWHLAPMPGDEFPLRKYTN
ncbi:uncharacterized protein BCR38DRAFT_456546 [Pseudomassariella vexata]|uniref:TauD/TfdA-like domain-containing protein n=1 Tax=Pseudomassariella vexata TaxID=1141098 RepID=A0A1Y2E2T6_9PEZI|nr:uncharacterized protein BCR38DRAFT_456546 [Pseudomassariella vexata]ORY65860.1 hypothetical protein BCR38DRAFT_456546 [Pseudomassariella vexata]